MEHFAGLERSTALVEDGRLLPVIERAYALGGTPDAVRQLAGGHVRGKLVVTP